MRCEDSSFVGTQILLDGNEYIRCKFVGCHFIYSATAKFVLNGNAIEGCTWEFRGAAAATVQVLTQLYRDAPDLVEATLDQIRGKKPKGPTLVH